jgi:cytochrome c oxidase subunit II
MMTATRFTAMRLAGWIGVCAVAAVIGLWASNVLAAGGPLPWEMNMRTGPSPVREKMVEMHDLLLVIITAITLFVLGLLVYVVVKFNHKSNPTPSTTTHNTTIEVIWTVVPVLILLVIAVPSFRLLYFLDKTQDAEMTVKVIGHQWYWEYQYPDHDDLRFDSYIVADNELKPGEPRLLTVDNRIVLPVGANVRILVTSQDVMHSWLIPSLGLQIYATPGRANETWVKVTEPGVYYGQCNQICGVNHGFMPIMVEALPKEQFTAWVAEAKKKFADAAPGAQPEQAVQAVRLAAVPLGDVPYASNR